MDPENQRLIANEGFINHFAITGALHAIFFNMEAAVSPLSHFRVIDTALENWKAVWNHVVLCGSVDFPASPSPLSPDLDRSEEALSDSEFWKRPGFWRYGTEYWLLLKALLMKRLDSRRRSERDASTETAWLGGIVGGEGSEEALCDDNEMQHLRDLMQDFQRLRVNSI
jgi:hypothetical protein